MNAKVRLPCVPYRIRCNIENTVEHGVALRRRVPVRGMSMRRVVFCIRTLGGACLALLYNVAPASTDLALQHFRQGEAAFTSRKFDQALSAYQKAIAIIPQDGSLTIGKSTSVKAVGSGRFASNVIEENIQQAEYFPNRRLDEIRSIQFEEQRRAAPPKLRLQWLALREPTQDNVLDGGESGAILVNVQNIGQSDALDVALEVKLNDIQGVSYDPRPLVGKVAPNESTVATIKVQADRSVATSSRQFSVQARERGGFDSNELDIALTTRRHEPAHILIENLALQELSNDGVIEPTETVLVTATVRNAGKGVSEALVARLDLGEDVFPGPEHREPVELGPLFPGEFKNVEFSFLTNGRFEDGQPIPATLRVVDGQDDVRQAEKELLATVHVPSDKVSINVRPINRPISLADTDIIDVDVSIPRGKQRNPDAVAVIIGNRNYRKAGLPAVKYAHNDARVMKDYLVTTLGFDEHNILYEEDATAATFNEIFGNQATYKGRLYGYLKAGQSDVFVYYSGHGAPDLNSKDAFFVPSDVDPNYIAMSGYSLDLFYENLAKLPAQRITVVLDTCFSGNSNGGLLLANVSPANIRVKTSNPALQNASIFTSTRAHQVSAWYHEKRHGLFTYYFLKGVAGAADEDRNQQITSLELGNYLSAEVSYQARRKYGLEQTPSLYERNSLILTELAE